MRCTKPRDSTCRRPFIFCSEEYRATKWLSVVSWLKGLINPPLETEDRTGNRREPGFLASLVHGSENAKQLPPHRGVRLPVQQGEFPLQFDERSVNRKVLEIGFHLLVLFLLDADVRMASAVAHRIAGKPDRRAANVLDAGRFRLEEWMLPMRGQEDEETLVTEIAKVGVSRPFAAVRAHFEMSMP